MFYSRNAGLQNQSVLYVQRGESGEPEVLIDPNTWSPDGTVRLATFSPSRDAKYAVYGISKSGSDWQEVQGDGARHTQDARRLDRVGQGLQRRLVWRRLLLQPLSGARLRARKRRRSTRITRCTTTRWARRNRRTRWSTRTRPTRSASTSSTRPRTNGSRY